MKEKVNGNWDIINKNGRSTFHAGKSKNSERANLNHIMKLLP